MRYVSDSKREKRNKKNRRPMMNSGSSRPSARRGSPSRAIHQHTESPTIIERDGVKVNISAAVKKAQKGTTAVKKPLDTDKISGILIKVLIGFGVAVAITLVMVVVYYFASSTPAAVQELEDIKGFPALVGGINIESPPVSVASLSPFLTDMVKTLPLGDPLTALSENCKNEEGLPTIGTPLLPDIDAIIELGPEYLLTSTPLTRQQKISLEQVGTNVLEFETPATVTAFSDLATEIATLFLGNELGPATATGIYGRFSDALAQFSTTINRPVEERPTYSLMFNLDGFSATPDTIEAQIFTSVLGRVAVEGQGYATTFDQIVSADPEVIILPDTFTMDDLSGTGLDVGTAAQNSRIFFIDMTYVETYNPLLLFTLAELADQVYPELELG